MEEAVRCNEIGDVLSIACISNQCQGWRGNQSIGLSLCQERTIGRSGDLELMLTGISLGFWFENSQNAAESTFIAVKCVWVLPTYFINTTPLSSYAFRVKYGMKKPRWLSSFTYNYSLSVLFLFPFSLINFVTKFAICIESSFFYRLFGLKIEDSLVYHDCFSAAKLEDKYKIFANCIYCPLMLCWIYTFVTDKEMDNFMGVWF